MHGLITLDDLCAAIDMPSQATDILRHTDCGLSDADMQTFVKRLCGEDFAAAADELHGKLQDDADGFKILSVQLRAALQAQDGYRARTIPAAVYIATMRGFSRFVREYKVMHGAYGFDRWWWVGRQTACKLFRLGTLEFEQTERGIAVHIPSDADLSPAAVDESLAQARRFFASDDPFTCTSWLLSPALEKVLPPESNILRFQARFYIESVDETAESYKIWVYKNAALRPEEFPEETALQRNLKRYVLSGGKVGEARGTLSE